MARTPPHFADKSSGSESGELPQIRNDSITFIGTLPDAADDLPITPPNGLLWMHGQSWTGDGEAYGIADCRVIFGNATMDFVITEADALLLRDLLNKTIKEMQTLTAISNNVLFGKGVAPNEDFGRGE